MKNEDEKRNNIPEDHRFPKNTNSLRWRLINTMNELDFDQIKVGKAKEMSNIAGKLINSCKVQCEYYALKNAVRPVGQKIEPQIDFLIADEEYDEGSLQ